MVRALIFALFSTFASLSQDSVSVFKIRPPELRIEGLFCNDYAITEGTKTMYYLTYEGEAYQFETKLTQEDFYKELIKEQNDFPYEKGTYSLHRKNEKAIIKMRIKTERNIKSDNVCLPERKLKFKPNIVFSFIMISTKNI